MLIDYAPPSVSMLSCMYYARVVLCIESGNAAKKITDKINYVCPLRLNNPLALSLPRQIVICNWHGCSPTDRKTQIVKQQIVFHFRHNLMSFV